MSILIKGTEMPMGGRILIVFPSGSVLEVSADATQDIFRETQAVSVPPHGRLIDVEELKEWVLNWFEVNRYYHPYAKDNNIPTTELYDIIDRISAIIDAEEGE